MHFPFYIHVISPSMTKDKWHFSSHTFLQLLELQLPSLKFEVWFQFISKWKPQGKSWEEDAVRKASVEDLLVFTLYSWMTILLCLSHQLLLGWETCVIEGIEYEWLMGTKMIISNMPKSRFTFFFFYSQQRIEVHEWLEESSWWKVLSVL